MRIPEISRKMFQIWSEPVTPGARRDKSGAQQMGGGGVFFCLFLRILKNPLIWFSIGVKKDPLSSSKSILSDFGGASVLWTLRFTGAAVPKISNIVFCVSTDPGAPVGEQQHSWLNNLHTRMRGTAHRSALRGGAKTNFVGPTGPQLGLKNRQKNEFWTV